MQSEEIINSRCARKALRAMGYLVDDFGDIIFMSSQTTSEGVVLARFGKVTINIDEDNRIYVRKDGQAAYASCGAKGVVHYDCEDFTVSKKVSAKVAKLLGVQRSNRLKNWRRDSDDHYEKHELELVTEI
jgi:hypothetical protein